jgi:DNA-binding transcriptional ArsR family regulator
VNDDSALVEQLSDKVHRAWMAEKQRQGFADHVFEPRSGMVTATNLCARQDCEFSQVRHHADMLPYADLAENVKEYDRATVRTVLGALREAGYLIVPNMTVPA